MQTGWVLAAGLAIAVLPISGAQAERNEAAFGIAPGTRLSSLDAVQIDGTRWKLRSVPRPHEALESYTVRSSDDEICEISGASWPRNIESLNDKFNLLKDQLTAAFGQSNIDELSMPNLKGMRHLRWERIKPFHSVNLLFAENNGKQFIVLGFEFRDMDECLGLAKPNPFK